jgi:hypothetical protein
LRPESPATDLVATPVAVRFTFGAKNGKTCPSLLAASGARGAVGRPGWSAFCGGKVIL